MRSQAVRITK
jgi:hypothetical protein